MNNIELAAELEVLTVAIASHKARIDVAAEARDDAFEFCLPKDGWRYDVSQVDLYPAATEADRTYRKLCDDDGYYWACSRAKDLEMLLGLGANPQMPFHFLFMMPATHERVAPWAREVA